MSCEISFRKAIFLNHERDSGQPQNQPPIVVTTSDKTIWKRWRKTLHGSIKRRSSITLDVTDSCIVLDKLTGCYNIKCLYPDCIYQGCDLKNHLTAKVQTCSFLSSLHVILSLLLSWMCVVIVSLSSLHLTLYSDCCYYKCHKTYQELIRSLQFWLLRKHKTQNNVTQQLHNIDQIWSAVDSNKSLHPNCLKDTNILLPTVYFIPLFDSMKKKKEKPKNLRKKYIQPSVLTSRLSSITVMLNYC